MPNKDSHSPPNWVLSFFRWYCHPDYLEDLEGDLMERFEKKLDERGVSIAKRLFILDVLRLFRPSLIRSFPRTLNIFDYAMFKNYFKIGWRNLLKDKGHSLINIGGLAIGMAVAMLIALWIHDELSYNVYHKNHDKIFKVMKNEMHSGTIYTGDSQPFALTGLLRASYGDYFEHIAMEVAGTGEHLIASEKEKITQSGRYMEPKGPEMLTLNMLQGSWTGLEDLNSIMISASLSNKLFNGDDNIGKVITMDGESKLQVTGIYEDLPTNSDFHGTEFIVPFDLFYQKYQWAKPDSWDGGNVSIYVQVAPNTDFNKVSDAIKNAHLSNMEKAKAEVMRPKLFLHPMDEWHLYSKFENGIRVMSDEMEFIWFYGIIGIFVLLLACINFVNLSTARAVKRAKEVGIRKTIGSLKRQLIGRFLVESLLFVALAFVLSLGLMLLALPWFNGIMGKTIHILWGNPWFWSACLSFILFSGTLKLW